MLKNTDIANSFNNDDLDLSILLQDDNSNSITEKKDVFHKNILPEENNDLDDYEHMQTLSDSSSDEESGKYNEYYFESDALVFRDCKDYRKVLATLGVLEAQRIQSLKDIDFLSRLKKKALENPEKFTNLLQKEAIKIPKFQNIAKVPLIDWSRYETSQDENLALENQEEFNGLTKQTIDGEGIENKHLSSKSKTTGGLSHKKIWTEQEQRKLEELLTIFPSEEVEAKRWQKIARALGNRTSIQVQSRVQKYFIKLAKAGLPIPGRTPSVSNTYRKFKPRAKFFQQALQSNSTFLTSYKLPSSLKDDCVTNDNIKMEDDPYENKINSDESLKDTKDYNELEQMIKLKENILKGIRKSNDSIHFGFQCSKCKENPILGTRWHCTDCIPTTNVNLCSKCADTLYETDKHNLFHNLEEILFPVQL